MNKGEMLDAIKKHLNVDKNTDFARFLGVSSQVVSNWYSRNTFDLELIYTKCFNISPEWLLTGQGEMLKRPVQKKPTSRQEEKTENTPSVSKDTNKQPNSQPVDSSIVELRTVNLILKEQLSEAREEIKQQANTIGRLEYQVETLKTEISQAKSYPRNVQGYTSMVAEPDLRHELP